MAVTAAQVDQMATAALPWYFNRGKAFQQAIERKPIIDVMERNAKTFPGGDKVIAMTVKGDYGNSGSPVTPSWVDSGQISDQLKGYSGGDQIGFYQPGNLVRAQYPWREVSIGLTFDYTTLKIDGLSIIDGNNLSRGTRTHNDADMTRIVRIFDDYLEDYGEQFLRGLRKQFWGDGSADPLGFAGIRSIIQDSPTTNTNAVGGIKYSDHNWWCNRAATAAQASADSKLQGAIDCSGATSVDNGGTLANFLQSEWRQLRRYGGEPNVFMAGSNFIEQLEKEYRANGYYSDSGFTRGGDLSVGAIRFKGVEVRYDPYLDDINRENYGYVWDSRYIFLMKMQDEWRKVWNPNRPPDRYVFFRSMTCTGNIVCTHRHCSGVYEIKPPSGTS